MASTSFSLGDHWAEFLDQQVESGRFGSKAEVVRMGLRMLEQQQEVDAEHVKLALDAMSDSEPRHELTDNFFDDIIQAGDKALEDDRAA